MTGEAGEKWTDTFLVSRVIVSTGGRFLGDGADERVLDSWSLSTMLSAFSLDPAWKWRLIGVEPSMSMRMCLDFSEDTAETSFVCHF